MSARVWSGAAVVSALLHGVGLGAIALSTDPDAAPEQSVPKSRFSIEAAEVPRSRAAPEKPLSDAAAEAETASTAAPSGRMVQSRADPLAPAPEPLAETSAGTAALKASDAGGTRARTASVSDITVQASATRTDTLAKTALPTQVIANVSGRTTARAANLSPATAHIAPLAPAPTALSTLSAPNASATAPLATSTAPPLKTLPAPQAIALTAPSSQTTVPTAPAPEPAILSAALGQHAAIATPDSPDSTALPLPALAGKAALAWSGGADTAVSATSLAAIAAFTQAGDLAAASAEVRDGIAGILASVPCARLQTTFLPDTGQLELRGHIPEDGLRGPVLAALQDQVGDAIALSDQLLILPRPQCGALAGIAGVGLPQSTEQLTDPAVIGEDGFARTYTYIDGERLRLDLTAPDYDAYIYMDYFVADGSVIHLQPNDIVPLTFAPAKSAQSVGRKREDQPYLELIVSAPFGQEIAAAFASNVPLYEGTRPIQEPAEAYLAFLKERVTQARARHADFKGEWVYFFISTQAR